MNAPCEQPWLLPTGAEPRYRRELHYKPYTYITVLECRRNTRYYSRYYFAAGRAYGAIGGTVSGAAVGAIVGAIGGAVVGAIIGERGCQL